MSYDTNVQVCCMCRDNSNCNTLPNQTNPKSTWLCHPIFHNHGLILLLLSSMAKNYMQMFYWSCMWLMFIAITVLSVEEINIAHTYLNKEKMNLVRSCCEGTGSTATKSPWWAPPLWTPVCESKTSRATVKLIPVKPGTPTSPLRPGIPGKFIVSPCSPVSSKKWTHEQCVNLIGLI